MRVLREFEAFGAVGLQPVSGPDALHRGFAQALRLGHAAGAPVGCPGRCGLQRSLHYLLDPVGVIGDPSAAAGCDFGQRFRPPFQEALAPEEDGRTTDAQLAGNRTISLPIGGQKHDARPDGDALRRILDTDPGFQSSALLGR